MKICAGDFFSPEFDSLKDQYLLKLASHFDFDAFLPGDKDLPHLRKTHLEQIPLICANLLEQGSPTFLPFITKTITGKRLIITGLWADETFALLPDSLKHIWSIIPWQETLTILKEGKKADDIFLIITQGPEDFDRAIMEYCPEVDLIISGEGIVDNLKPYSRGFIIETGKGNNSLSYLRFSPTHFQDTSSVKVEEYNSLPIFQYDPPPTPEVKALVDEYYQEWFKVLDTRRKQYAGQDKVFLGNRFCAKCHQIEYQSWLKSAHARAYETLKVPENRCLPCHTTGFGYPTGFWNLDSTPKLTGVGCEECHYVEKTKKIAGAHPSASITKENCRCHKAPYDDDFNFENDILKVIH